MKHVIDEFYKAKTSSFGKTMKGVGMTMEGSENNSVMFELCVNYLGVRPGLIKMNG